MTANFPVSAEWFAAQRRMHRQRVRVGKYAPYHDNPAGFFEQVLRFQLWPKQRELIEKVRLNQRVACRAGQKVSKTLSAVGIGLWWVATRPGPKTKVIFTAPTLHQVRDILWNELEAIWTTRPWLAEDLGGEFPKDPRAGIKFTSGALLVGKSTRKAEAMQGVSGSEVLYVIDEASGYPDDLYEAVRGNTAGGDAKGGAKILALSNPTKPSGWFFDAFNGKGKWVLHHISSEDSPNVIAGERVFEGLATRDFIEELREECGANYREHPFYQVRALGVFPTSSTNAVIDLGAVNKATERWEKPDRPTIDTAIGPLVIGVDPAWYGGDDAVCFPVRGWVAGEPKVISGKQTGPQIARAAMDLANSLRRMPEDRCVTIVVDHKGAGVSTVDALRTSDDYREGRIAVVEHDGASKPQDENKYSKRREEVWFGLGKWLDQGGVIPTMNELRRELLAPTYSFDPQARYLMESKKTLTKRMKKSPNLADALTLAVSHKPTRLQGGYEADRDESRAGLW